MARTIRESAPGGDLDDVLSDLDQGMLVRRNTNSPRRGHPFELDRRTCAAF
jgi:hypothetical protein